MSGEVIPVRVAARVRPLVGKEKGEGARSCVQTFPDRNSLSLNGQQFTYDFVFGPDSTQEDVFESIAAPLVPKLFQGFNATVFAYGQTGSGKTWTMGTEDGPPWGTVDDGVIPRIAREIFTRVQTEETADPDLTVAITCSMLEIYEERILDLLNPKEGAVGEGLPVREANGSVFVQDLSQRNIGTIEAAMEELRRGSDSRSKGATAMNARSSRSHAIFTLYLTISHGEDSTKSFKAKLNLVDLAGSERVKKTMATGQRLQEGIKINAGLSVLGNVINALTDPEKPHVPYRNSKLTRMLQDSLGGNSHTVMLVCVSPADSNAPESISSLRYAERAKKICNKPTVNQDPSAAALSKLKAENRELRERLEALGGSASGPAPAAASEELARLRKAKAQLEQEHRDSQTQLKSLMKDRIQLISQLDNFTASNEVLEERLQDMSEGIKSAAEGLRTGSGEVSREELAKELQSLLAVPTSPAPQADLSARKRSHDWLETPGPKGSGAEDEDEEEEEDTALVLQRQNAFSAKYQSVVEKIKAKTQLLESGADIERLQKEHEQETAELAKKIKALEKEKDELNKTKSNQTNATKIAEERRKKLATLEKELGDLRKKAAETRRLEKKEAENRAAILKAKSEIDDLRKTRVKLMKEMKSETEKHRRGVMEKDRTIFRLQRLEEKRKRELDAERADHQRKMEVCRKKIEESRALSQRLQNVHRTRDRKPKEGNSERDIQRFIAEELELVVDMAEANTNIAAHSQQRADLLKELARLDATIKKREKEEAEGSVASPAKRRRTMDGAQRNLAEMLERRAELQKQVEVQSQEISELSNRLAEFDADEKDAARWSCLSRLDEAKAHLTELFKHAATARQDLNTAKAERDALEANFEAARQRVKCLLVELSQAEEGASQEKEEGERKLIQAELAFHRRIQEVLAAKDHPALQDLLARYSEQIQELEGQVEALTAAPRKGKLSHSRSASALRPPTVGPLPSTLPATRTRGGRSVKAPQRLGVLQAQAKDEPMSPVSEAESPNNDISYHETPQGPQRSQTRRHLGLAQPSAPASQPSPSAQAQSCLNETFTLTSPDDQAPLPHSLTGLNKVKSPGRFFKPPAV